MFITKELVENVGKRHPMIRAAMVQAGDKGRIQAMKKALISIGACELTQKEVCENNFLVRGKKFSFCSAPLSLALLDEQDFERFPIISSPVKLEAAHIRNGVIGIRRKRQANA